MSLVIVALCVLTRDFMICFDYKPSWSSQNPYEHMGSEAEESGAGGQATAECESVNRNEAGESCSPITSFAHPIKCRNDAAISSTAIATSAKTSSVDGIRPTASHGASDNVVAAGCTSSGTARRAVARSSHDTALDVMIGQLMAERDPKRRDDALLRRLIEEKAEILQAAECPS